MAQTIIPADWQIKRLSGSLGASVTGPNISHVSEQDLDAIKTLLTAVSYTHLRAHET